ncbi:MAG: 4Fe-4S binding protein [bacterium]|nr:4Fe-4S binding protein [bacterium]
MFKEKLVLNFPHSTIDQPIIYRLIKDHDVEVNILRARITPKEEGEMVVELTGRSKQHLQQVRDYLIAHGVKLQPLEKDITWIQDRCTHCTVCVAVCPVRAFKVDLKTKEITFDREKCIACELCIPACPYRAMEIRI